MADAQPNPTPRAELRPGEDPADVQRLHCAGRPACLDRAARQRWEAFACDGCHAFAPMPAAQWRDEVGQLADVGRVLVALLRRGDAAVGLLRKRGAHNAPRDRDPTGGPTDGGATVPSHGATFRKQSGTAPNRGNGGPLPTTVPGRYP